MLTKNQWLWCAEHHRSIKKIAITFFVATLLIYCYVFIDRFFWQRNAPVIYRPAISQMDKFNCRTDEVFDMFIPSEMTSTALSESLANTNPGLASVRDARALLLEFYETTIFGSEILEKRPECLGAFIADEKNSPEPYAILVVDRSTGKTIFRIARLHNYLTR